MLFVTVTCQYLECILRDEFNDLCHPQGRRASPFGPASHSLLGAELFYSKGHLATYSECYITSQGPSRSFYEEMLNASQKTQNKGSSYSSPKTDRPSSVCREFNPPHQISDDEGPRERRRVLEGSLARVCRGCRAGLNSCAADTPKHVKLTAGLQRLLL